MKKNELRLVKKNMKKNELRLVKKLDNYTWEVIYIYDLDYQDDVPKYYLFKIIHNENKDELRMIHMPNVKIDFDELFDIDWYYFALPQL